MPILAAKIRVLRSRVQLKGLTSGNGSNLRFEIRNLWKTSALIPLNLSSHKQLKDILPREIVLDGFIIGR
jgi:hypothetical protein